MDEVMAANWNATVGPDDEVWHLGDFALHRKPDAMAALLERLHGTKHLITGNNDGPATLALPGWASVQPYAELSLGERRRAVPLRLSHLERHVQGRFEPARPQPRPVEGYAPAIRRRCGCVGFPPGDRR
ncbi:hypothetical protein [Azospirillum brasilense]|uniref:hypothetical protein n=1 Tax=Azospirillum brasilense TaxID=192 RepID=UPI001EDB796D|nr:hypothetical protein [Azospirillum brasilense]